MKKAFEEIWNYLFYKYSIVENMDTDETLVKIDKVFERYLRMTGQKITSESAVDII